MQSEPVIQSEIPLPLDAPPRRWRPRSSAAWNSSAADRGVKPAVSAEELLALQQAFERYEIIDCLERGGQGVVYRARQHGSSRTVALKLLLDGPLANERQRYRFEREIELIARLRHPNIVTLFDSGVTRGRLFYAMEFIDGLPIDDYAVLQDLSPRSIVQLLSPVCRAVHFAHQNGVIHRDLKPAHILVGTDGQPRVFDFGLAKDLADSSSDGRFSCTGQVVGTLPYLSPEQAGGQDGRSDVRSDVYALGIILFQLVTELFPYPVDGPPEQVRRTIISTDPLPLRRAVALSAPDRAPRSHEVNRDLEAIVGKALRKEKRERYQSAAELADDLDRYLAGDAVTARANSRWYVARKFARRHRAAIAVGGLVGAVLLGSGVAVSLALMEARQSLDLVRKATDKSAGLISFAINKLEKDIRPLPGGVRVRNALIDELGPKLKEIEALAKSDPALERLSLDFVESRADIAGEQGGGRERAAGLYRTLIAQVREINRGAISAQTALRLAALHRKLAGVMEEPEPVLGTATDYAEQALIDSEHADEARLELCRSLVELAAHYTNTGMLECAVEAANRVLELGATAGSDDSGDWLRLVARGRNERGFARQRLGLGDDAVIDLRVARNIRETLAESNPTDVFARDDLLRAYFSLAIALRDRDKSDESMSLLERGAAIGNSLAELDPTATLWNQNRFRVHCELGRLQLDRSDTRSATENVRLASRLFGDPLTTWGSDADRDENHASLLLLEGRLLLADGNAGEALARFQSAERLYEQMAETQPGERRWLQHRAGVWYWLGLAHRNAGNLLAAIQSHEFSLELSDSVADAFPESIEIQINRIRAQVTLSNTLSRSDRPEHGERARILLDDAGAAVERFTLADRLGGHTQSRRQLDSAIRGVRLVLAERFGDPPSDH